MPSDYVNGVNFVGANGASNGISLNREDEDAEESDEELEARRHKKHEEELEKQYFAQPSTSILGRMETAEEVANLVVYICSRAASATTGATLRADGGMVRTIA